MSDLPFADRTDFENAERGFVDALDPCVVTAADGRVVWDLRAYAYLEGDNPGTVHPSLWRQAQLCAKHGLFEVTSGIYQVRGMDISNMTLVEGDTGVIVIDPLISTETAAASLALYRKNRGDRPVTGVIYTHSHADHFGGVKGVLPDGAGEVPILAPEGFLEHAVSENVYAGVAMNRRATYMYGVFLDKSPTGQVGTGLGIATSDGSLSLIAPTVDITRTGQEETIDGVRIVFQITPGTEAPAEMNFHFPDHRALCMAENATHNLHNLLTLRGALVRDPRVWSRYLDEAIEMFGVGTDVAFASHHWPTWGTANATRYLSQQRDLYAYLHDQTLRMLNNGATGMEIAEDIQLPPNLESAWHARGYYGSVSHNVKAIYQRYMGWFDGNPTSLWEHPPQAAATRYVDVIGGQQAVLDKARSYAAAGDLRFAAELLKHAVFASPDDTAAREALAGVYERLGYGCRERHLAQLLPHRRAGTPPRSQAVPARRHRHRDGRGAHHRAVVRHAGHPGGRAARRPRVAGHRLAVHRHRHRRPAHPVQRRADPDREPEDRGQSRPDAGPHQAAAPRPAGRRRPGRDRAHRRSGGAGQAAGCARHPGPRVPDRDAVTAGESPG